MANFNVEVIVDPTKAVKGSKQAEKSLKKIEQQADKLRKSIRNVFAGVGTGFLVAQIVQLTDSYTNLQNRLRVVTNGTGELAKATGNLYNIARETRSSFAGTVELYSRLSMSARALGVDEQELTHFTKSMNQAIILSGASGREAQAGLIQLSQGIASGALRGDELRSVLEQLPVVADVIAKQMGVTRGELIDLGATGVITSKQILDGFKNAREELEERFAKTIPTISQSFQVLKNSLTLTIGEFNTANGAAKVFSATLLGLADNLENVLRLLSAVAITVGVTLATKAVPALIAIIKKLTMTMMANPLGLFLVALTSVISLLYTFGDVIKIQKDKLATIADVGSVVWKSLSDSATVFINWFQKNFGIIGVYISKVLNSGKLSFSSFVLFAANKMDQLAGVILGVFNVLKSGVIIDAIKSVFSVAMNAVLTVVERGINNVIEKVNGLLIAINSKKRLMSASLNLIAADAIPTTQDLGKKLSDAFQEGLDFNFYTEATKDIFKDSEKIAAERVKAMQDAAKKKKVIIPVGIELDKSVEDIISQLYKKEMMLSLSIDERNIEEKIFQIEKNLKRNLSDVEEPIIRALLQSIKTLTEGNEVYDNIKEPIREYTNMVRILDQLLVEKKISAEEYAAALMNIPLVESLENLKQDSSSDPFANEMATIEQQLLEKNLLLQQGREADRISEQEYLNLSLQARVDYDQAVRDVETKRASFLLGVGKSTFGSLASIAKSFGGEQSKTYQTLFKITKAFAIADTTVQIIGAISKAFNEKYPANIAAVANVASLTAGLVSQISSVQFSGGFKTGGDFTVAGSGAADSQLVAFKATPGEKVSIRTPKQSQSEQAAPQAQENRIVVANFVDKDLFDSYLQSNEGTEVFMNMINTNASSVNALLNR